VLLFPRDEGNTEIRHRPVDRPPAAGGRAADAGTALATRKIVAVLGIRRSGKTYLLYETMRRLEARGWTGANWCT